MIYWFIVDKLIDWSFGFFFDWLISRLYDGLFDKLMSYLIAWLIDWLIYGFIGRLINGFNDWLCNRFIDWLIFFLKIDLLIRLVSGRVEFEYSLEAGARLLLVSPVPVTLGAWHSVKARRYHQAIGDNNRFYI